MGHGGIQFGGMQGAPGIEHVLQGQSPLLAGKLGAFEGFACLGEELLVQPVDARQCGVKGFLLDTVAGQGGGLDLFQLALRFIDRNQRAFHRAILAAIDAQRKSHSHAPQAVANTRVVLELHTQGDIGAALRFGQGQGRLRLLHAPGGGLHIGAGRQPSLFLRRVRGRAIGWRWLTKIRPWVHCLQVCLHACITLKGQHLAEGRAGLRQLQPGLRTLVGCPVGLHGQSCGLQPGQVTLRHSQLGCAAAVLSQLPVVLADGHLFLSQSMKRPITRFTFALVSMLCLSSTSWAAAPVDDDILASLSRCDGSFFESLQRQEAVLSASPHFVKTAGVAYFKVADRTDPAGSTRRFATPLKISGLGAVAYFDENMGLSGDEAFISWGFLLRASVAEVLQATQGKVWDGSRLLLDGSSYTRTEWQDANQADSSWQKVETPGGAEPQPGTVERILVIEAYDKDPALTRFGCTLQGTVTPALLKAARPDLKSAKSK